MAAQGGWSVWPQYNNCIMEQQFRQWIWIKVVFLTVILSVTMPVLIGGGLLGATIIIGSLALISISIWWLANDDRR